jgi:hypothetical protein
MAPVKDPAPSPCTLCSGPSRRSPSPFTRRRRAPRHRWVREGAPLSRLDPSRSPHRGRGPGHAQGRARAAGAYRRGRRDRAAAAARGRRARLGRGEGRGPRRVRRPQGLRPACPRTRRPSRETRRRRPVRGRVGAPPSQGPGSHTVVAAHGTDRLEAVTVAALDGDGRVRPGTERRIPCDTLAVGHGMLPHTDLAERSAAVSTGSPSPWTTNSAPTCPASGPPARPRASAARRSRRPRAGSPDCPSRRGSTPVPDPSSYAHGRQGACRVAGVLRRRRHRLCARPPVGPSRSPTTPSCAGARRCPPPRSGRPSTSSAPGTYAP